MKMNNGIDARTLLGFFSATGLPPLFKSSIGFVHPALYTLTCGKSWIDGSAACYADDRLEAILYLVLTLCAVGYGVWTLLDRLRATPAPPAGSSLAVLPHGQTIVTTDQNGVNGLATAKARPGSVTAPEPITLKGT